MSNRTQFNSTYLVRVPFNTIVAVTSSYGFGKNQVLMYIYSLEIHADKMSMLNLLHLNLFFRLQGCFKKEGLHNDEWCIPQFALHFPVSIQWGHSYHVHLGYGPPHRA